MACDVAANGGEPYWWFFVGQWTLAEGTSFSSPVVAGILADVTAARITAGKPAPGYLNSILYTNTAAQQAFRDITSGGTSNYQAGPGWDPPTGWGAPNASSLATALP
jgi:kumamolisin